MICLLAEATVDLAGAPPDQALDRVVRATESALQATCTFATSFAEAELNTALNAGAVVRRSDFLFVPVRAGVASPGALTVTRSTPAFGDAEVAFVHALAATAGRVLAKAQLRATRKALSDAAREFAAATGDEKNLVKLMAQRVSTTFHDLVIVRRVSADGRSLRVPEGIAHPDPAVDQRIHALPTSPFPLGEGVAGETFLSGRPLLVDPSTEEGRRALAANPDASLLRELDVTCLMTAPLKTQEHFVGELTVVRTQGGPRFSPDDFALFEDLAAHASVALMNSHLVAERSRREEVLRRGFLDASPDAVFIADQHGTIILANVQAEATFGYSRAELVGHSIDLLVPDRFRGSHDGRRARYHTSPQARPIGALDLYARRKDGSEFAAEIMLSPIETADGTLVAAAVRDVTERRREMDERNQRMEEASRLKSQFVANMSHELRTPLNAIIGFASLMYSGKAGALAADHKDYLGDMLTSARHLLQLINDILDLAKVESGRMELQCVETKLEDVVREVKDIVRGLAAEKRLRLAIHVDPAASRLECDPRMLKQVLYNYLANAIKFTNEGGSVVIRSALEGDDQLRISVEDTGIGIAESDQHRLFIEFQQLEGGAAKRYQGTGLGLALVKRIMEAHHGSVEVTSEVGRGSTFSALFPRQHSKG